METWYRLPWDDSCPLLLFSMAHGGIIFQTKQISIFLQQRAMIHTSCFPPYHYHRAGVLTPWIILRRRKIQELRYRRTKFQELGEKSGMKNSGYQMGNSKASVNKYRYPSSEIMVITTGVKPALSSLFTLFLLIFQIGQWSKYHYYPILRYPIL